MEKAEHWLKSDIVCLTVVGLPHSCDIKIQLLNLFLVSKIHFAAITRCPFVYWWFISSNFLFPFFTSWTHFFLIKVQMRSSSLPNRAAQKWTFLKRTKETLWSVFLSPSSGNPADKSMLSCKLTCIICVLCRFWSPSFRFCTWLFSCCLSSKLFASSASRCFRSSLIFNSCCKDKEDVCIIQPINMLQRKQ